MKKKLLILTVVLAVIFGYIFYQLRLTQNVDLQKAHGMVDIRQSSLSFETSGRIVELLVDEGDLVVKGDLLARLDTQAIDHQIAITKGECKALEAKLLELENGYQKEDIKIAKANLDNLDNALAIASLTYERYQRLFAQKAISAQERDQAFYQCEQLRAQRQSCEKEYEKLKNGYREETITAQRAQTDSCNANLNFLYYKRDEQSVLKAPYSGQIRSRLQELGDMTSPQNTVYELSQIDNKRVRVYVQEKQLSFLHINDKATVILSNDQKLYGRIAKISNTAMFTPKSVQTEELRADLVYEVRIDVEDPRQDLRLGQPVTVSFEK
ncbi:MAG: HlyD family efflux transporter periplasmic adaptor subunit [Succinatimonas sp.]|nr:HlyD family efflux transporter periplasmic adaptor subunit [Succinatimonas sp.]